MPPVYSVTSVAELVCGGLCPGMNAWSLLQRTLCRAIHWLPWFQSLGNSSCNMTCDCDAGKSAQVLETIEAVASQKNYGRMPFARQCGWVFTSIMKRTAARCHDVICPAGSLILCQVFSAPRVKSSSLCLIWNLASFLGRWNWRGTSWSTGRLGGRGATWGCSSTEHPGILLYNIVYLYFIYFFFMEYQGIEYWWFLM